MPNENLDPEEWEDAEFVSGADLPDDMNESSNAVCDCMVPYLDGTGQHWPSCSVFDVDTDDLFPEWDAAAETADDARRGK